MNNEEKILAILEKMDGRLNNLETDMVGMKKDMVDVKKDVANMKKDMVDVKKDVANMKKDMVNVKEDLKFTKESALRMEIDHGDQLKALWDVYDSVRVKQAEHTDILVNIEHKVNNLEAYVSVHNYKLEALEK